MTKVIYAFLNSVKGICWIMLKLYQRYPYWHHFGNQKIRHRIKNSMMRAYASHFCKFSTKRMQRCSSLFQHEFNSIDYIKFKAARHFSNFLGTNKFLSYLLMIINVKTCHISMEINHLRKYFSNELRRFLGMIPIVIEPKQTQFKLIVRTILQGSSMETVL